MGKQTFSHALHCAGGPQNGLERNAPPVAEAELRCSKPGSISKWGALLVCRVLAGTHQLGGRPLVPDSALLLHLGVREPFPNPPRPLSPFQSSLKETSRSSLAVSSCEILLDNRGLPPSLTQACLSPRSSCQVQMSPQPGLQSRSGRRGNKEAKVQERWTCFLLLAQL